MAVSQDKVKIERLRELRVQAGMSQAALAKAIGLSQGYLSGVERGEYDNEPVLDKAIGFLDKVLDKTADIQKKSKNQEQPFSEISSRDVMGLTWAWSQFPRGRAISDLCDEAKIDKKTYCLFIADVVGSGAKGRLEAAQLRFGFHAIASSLSPFNVYPSAFVGPIARALHRTKRRTAGPPSLAFLTVDCEMNTVSAAFYGLPQPLVVRKNNERAEKLPMPAADLLTRFQGRATEYTTISLEAGDSILIYTDGFYDWLRRTGQQSNFNAYDLLQEAASGFRGNAARIIRTIADGRLGVDRSVPAEDASVMVISRKK